MSRRSYRDDWNRGRALEVGDSGRPGYASEQYSTQQVQRIECNIANDPIMYTLLHAVDRGYATFRARHEADWESRSTSLRTNYSAGQRQPGEEDRGGREL